MKKIRLFILLTIAYANVSMAEVFVRVDEFGNTTYTNIKDSVDMEEPTAKEEVQRTDKNATNVKKDPNLIVAPEVQSARDVKRKQILQAELDSEISLAKTEKDQIVKQAHERNIELLKKELAK